MNEPLTDRQRQVLQFIQQEIIQHRRPPTTREISDEFGFASPRAATQHILMLERKGYLKRILGQSRNLVLTVAPEGVPIVGDVAAGQPILAAENYTGALNMADAFGPGELFAVRVKGDSMRDAGILDGDAVVVRHQATVPDGAIGVALLNGEATVKRIYKIRQGCRLQPENPSFSPIEIKAPRDPDETPSDFRIAGPVVGVVRRVRQ